MMTAFWHWVLTVTGINNESGKWYAFWSGFGANFGEVTLLAGVLAAWHRVNCHTKDDMLRPACGRLSWKRRPLSEGDLPSTGAP
jgi:hypothetical protein